MENLSGNWEGEYSVDIGTEEQPKVEYHTFRLELQDKEGELTGNCQDLTLDNEPSTINGFQDDNIISFIKKYQRLIYADDSAEYYGDSSEQHPDIHYSGSFNESENCLEGTWEIQVSEEQIGMQTELTTEIEFGRWYVRRVQ
ncbi:MAG: hypothetical protein ACJA2S_005554 [Cyclobacteriaceae bacterium]|jgi:hypothetical protein